MNGRRVCANCEELIECDAVEIDGAPYCCSGCVLGGPCICPPRPAAARFEDVVEGLGDPEPPTADAPATRDLAVASRPVVLRIGRFVDQQDLLFFASVFERDPAVLEVSLTGGGVDAAWFAVQAESPDAVLAALDRLEGFEIDAALRDTSIEARILYATAYWTTAQPLAGRPPVAPPPPPPRPVEELPSGPSAEVVLPPKPRFRVFRRPSREMEPVAEHRGVADDWRARPSLVAEHVTLHVYPFRSFASLDEFQSAIKALRGVMSTRVRGFYHGSLRLAIDYEDIVPLVERLNDLDGFDWCLVSESPQELQIQLQVDEPLESSEGGS